MSTKLWNGMILLNCNLEQSLPKLQALRRTCLPKLQNAMEDRVAELLIFEADLPLNFHQFGRANDQPINIYQLIDADMRAALMNRKVGSDWDFAFSLRLIPKGNDVLVLHHMWNNPGYKEALQEAGFEDYHYQDQTDPPEDMPEDEWKRREQDWDDYYFRAYPEHQCEPGFTYTIIDWQDIRSSAHRFNTEKIIATITTESLRRYRVAHFLAQVDAALSQRYNGNIWSETQKRLPEVILCEDKEAIVDAILCGMPLC